MLVVIDNYDSFTYNLVQYIGELGGAPTVFRNDRVTLEEIEALDPSHLLISPGPGTPQQDAGISNAVIERFQGRVPILGVCLGHQCIAHTFGGEVGHAPRLMHGKVSRMRHNGDPLFAGIPAQFEATRYHSLIVHEPMPKVLLKLASTPEGEIMAIKHRDHPTYGVQFHPESILTPHGMQLLRNFLGIASATVQAKTQSAEATEPFSLRAALDKLLDREHLSALEAEAVMMAIMSGQATEAQIGALLAALRGKGETVDEITGFARAMRRHVTKVAPQRRPLLDTCGTGGDGAHSFNISTTAAFVVAGAGVAIAKHGNRSVSSKSGSADVLQALGVNLDLTPEQVADCIDAVGFGFLFAPKLHPAMKYAIGPRREMGVRTVFNILGPLTNPAGASTQLIGVFSPALVEPIACVLRELGSESALVVNSHDGLDELTAAGPNHVAYLREGVVKTTRLDPQSLGLEPAGREALLGGDAQQNAAITRDILAGAQGPRRDVVLLNAGMALMTAGVASSPRKGLALAAESIDSGAAAQVLAHLIEYTQGAA